MENIKLAVAGVGNNISALLQGKFYYEKLIANGEFLPGVLNSNLHGFQVVDFDICAAFDVRSNIIGMDLSDAIFEKPNCYPVLDIQLPRMDVDVEQGLTAKGENFNAVVSSLKASGAEILLYSLPTGYQEVADWYAKAALEAGVTIVNCTPDNMARSQELSLAFAKAGLFIVGDDLQSHIGSSIVHGTLLDLVQKRGLTVDSTYQLNFGGNEDFKNLYSNGANKAVSKQNALRNKLKGDEPVNLEVIPSAGCITSLVDNKIGMIRIDGRGWAGQSFEIELKLKVQDSSNAAGVIIDLIRIAANAHRKKVFDVEEIVPILKSPATENSLV